MIDIKANPATLESTELHHQESLLECIQDAILATDANFILKYWNRAAEELYGWKADEVIGRPVGQVIRSEFSQSQREAALRILAERGRYRVEVLQYTRDGRPIWVEGTTMALWDESGQLTGYVSVNRDISQRKQAEAEIQSLARFPDENPNPILRIAGDGVILYANQSSQPLLQAWKRRPGQTLPARLRRKVALGLRAGKVMEIEQPADGRLYSLQLVPFPGDGYANIYGRDITEARRYEQDLQRKVDELAGLYEVSKAIGELDDLGETYGMLSKRLAHLLGARWCAIALLDPASGEIRAQTPGYGLGDEVLAQVIFPSHLTGEAWDLLARGPFVANRLEEVPPSFIPQAQAVGIQSVLAIPFTISQQFAGVVFAANKPGGFSEDDLHVSSVVASQVGRVVEKARLFAATQRHLLEEALIQEVILAGVEAQDEDELISSFTGIVGRWLGLENVGMVLLDEARGELRPHPSYRYHGEGQPLVLQWGEGIIGAAIASGRARRADDVSLDPAYRDGFSQTRSELAVPLKAGDEILGAINLESPELNAFSAADERLLVTLSGHMAMAISRLRAAAHEHEQRTLAEALSNTATALNSSLDMEALLDRILENLNAVLPFQGASILLIEGDLGRVLRHRGEDDQYKGWKEGRQLRLSEIANLSTILKTQAPLVISDAREYPGWMAFPETVWVRSNVSAPIRDNDDVIGLLVLDHGTPGFYTPAHAARLQAFADQVAIALKNARLYQSALKLAERQAVLHRVSQQVTAAGRDPESVYLAIHQAVRQLMPAEAFAIALTNGHLGEIELAYAYDLDGRSPRQRVAADKSLSGQVIASGAPIRIDDLESWERQDNVAHFGSPRHVRSILAVPIQLNGKVFGMLSTQSYQPNAYDDEDLLLLEMLAAHAAAALDNARLFAETNRRLAALEGLNRISTSLRSASSLEEMLPSFLDEALAVVHAEAGDILLYYPEQNELRQAAARGWLSEIGQVHIQPGQGIAGTVFASGLSHVASQFKTDPLLASSVVENMLPGWDGACLPLRTSQETVGVLFVAVKLPRQLTREEVSFLETVSEIAGSSIQRMRLHEQTELRLQRLSALRNVDMAINASLDLRINLNILLDQLVGQLKADAADILLVNRHTQELEMAARRGFRGTAAFTTRLRPGQGVAGQVVLERQTLHLADLNKFASSQIRPELMTGEGFVAYFGVPLIAKGQVKGVLEAYFRRPFEPDPEWREFLETLAGQAAIAIDNAHLFEELQRSNDQLSLAYDATLEGWAHALELRDRETEGHSQRVTELTLRIARAMGMGEAELVHVRRGALLHDIGKLGVPDEILNKPGPLSEAEWEVMRRHPAAAYQLLSAIPHLRPALDIPYCHHEKWDGSGYPRGLSGEAIPLAARIFAVVDVWDALRSDRPYRPAWSEAEALRYIREQAGKHFDPRVVEVFFGEIGVRKGEQESGE